MACFKRRDKAFSRNRGGLMHPNVCTTHSNIQVQFYMHAYEAHIHLWTISYTGAHLGLPGVLYWAGLSGIMAICWVKNLSNTRPECVWYLKMFSYLFFLPSAKRRFTFEEIVYKL